MQMPHFSLISSGLLCYPGQFHRFLVTRHVTGWTWSWIDSQHLSFQNSLSHLNCCVTLCYPCLTLVLPCVTFLLPLCYPCFTLVLPLWRVIFTGRWSQGMLCWACGAYNWHFRSHRKDFKNMNRQRASIVTKFWLQLLHHHDIEIHNDDETGSTVQTVSLASWRLHSCISR